MRSEKNTPTASSAKYSASTLAAIVEARSGKSGGILLLANHDGDERAERENGDGAGQPQRPHDREAVAAVLRVVVIAVEQNLIDRVADLPRGCVEQRKPQIPRSVVDAEQV